MMQTANKDEETLRATIDQIKGSFSEFPQLGRRLNSLLILSQDQRSKDPLWQAMLQSIAKCRIDHHSDLTESICEQLLEVDDFSELASKLPSINSVTNFQRYIRKFPEKHTDDLFKKLFAPPSCSTAVFYSLLNADTSGRLWLSLFATSSGSLLSWLARNENFSENFFSRVTSTAEEAITFIQKQVAFLTDSKTMEKVGTKELEVFFPFLQRVLSVIEEKLLTNASVETMAALEDALGVVREIPYNKIAGAFVLRQKLTEQVEKILITIKEKQPQLIPRSTQKKICLIFHGTCNECGNPSTISTLSKTLRAIHYGNTVCEFGGPGAMGSDTTIIANEAFKSFKYAFVSWLSSLGDPPDKTSNFELFLAGYSRGAVNCFRVNAAIHSWLSDKETLLKDCPVSLQKTLQKYKQEDLVSLFNDKVHISFYAHDPVPGTPKGIMQSLVFTDGWKDQEKFAWPPDSCPLKIVKRKLVVVAKDETRCNFESLLDRKGSGVLGRFSDSEIQVLPGNHSAGICITPSYNDLDPKIHKFLESCTSVDNCIDQLVDDLWKIDNGSFCACVNAQLITLSLMQGVAGLSVEPSITIGDRNNSHVVQLAGSVTPKNKLDLYASTKKHMTAFVALTNNDSDYGGGRSIRDVGQRPENYTKHGKEFFVNNDEALILKDNYPEIYGAITATKNVMPDLKKIDDTLNIQLLKLIRENPCYAEQVIMFLVAKSNQKTLSFVDPSSPSYFSKYNILESKKNSDKTGSQQQIDAHTQQQLTEVIEKAQTICKSFDAEPEHGTRRFT